MATFSKGGFSFSASFVLVRMNKTLPVFKIGEVFNGIAFPCQAIKILTHCNIVVTPLKINTREKSSLE